MTPATGFTCPDPLASPELHRLLPGLRQALDADHARHMLQETLFVRRGREVIERCRPGKALYAGPDDCRLRYALDLRNVITGRPWSATMVGRLFSTPAAATAYAQGHVAPIAARMDGRSEVEPFTALYAEIPAAALVVHPFPVDPALPTLVEATDPRVVTDILRSAGDATRRDRATRCLAVEVIRYPRRDRCVLRYAVDGRGPIYGPIYAKVYADGSADRVRRALGVLRHELPQAGNPPLRVPACLGYRPELRLVLLDEVRGAPALPALLRGAAGGDASAEERARSEVTTAARVLATVHACASPPGRPRTLEGDLVALGRELAVLRPVVPEFAARVATLLGHLAAAASQGPILEPCCAHGDYTPGQLLVDGSQRGLVDVDTLCLAEPALDVGQFLAYLRVALSGPGTRLGGDLGERFLEAYVDGAGLVGDRARALRTRARVYQVLSLARVAVRGWLQLKAHRVHAALTVLSQEAP